MKVIKKQSKKVYKDKNGNEHNYYNYYLQCENGKRILIKTVSVDDLKRLDMIAEYER